MGINYKFSSVFELMIGGNPIEMIIPANVKMERGYSYHHPFARCYPGWDHTAEVLLPNNIFKAMS